MDTNSYYWRIEDGRIWGSAEAGWMDESEIPAGKHAQNLMDSGQPATVEYLKATIQFYKFSLGGLADLADVKAEKKAAIDANTNRLIERDGMLYQGEHFAMTQTAKINWNSLAAMKDALPYPTAILTMSDQLFAIADQAALMQFLSAAMLFETTDQNSPAVSGRILRMQVEAATTVEEVNAIIDDRE